MQMDFYYCILVNHFDRSNLRLLICRHRTIVVDWLHRLTDFIDDVHSGSHFTKCCVISIQKVGIRLYNKKLTAGRCPDHSAYAPWKSHHVYETSYSLCHLT